MIIVLHCAKLAASSLAQAWCRTGVACTLHFKSCEAWLMLHAGVRWHLPAPHEAGLNWHHIYVHIEAHESVHIAPSPQLLLT